ncbi:protein ARABIDILLO 2-like [Pyrus ussuriensis x Pyrus communis]|uniref:Protein ARABIDILLO 2-like n=1 Tax=Pyrus ussuriensis x Pyrus communis TaxID=2448454 RepID=A0A5N5FZT3_9ROSA|nr:protein ARABIDILLO 2-like [Pyrus ussuriensis x Pyrus communis]
MKGGPAVDEGVDDEGGAEKEGKGEVDEVEEGLEWVCGDDGGEMHLGSGGPD